MRTTIRSLSPTLLVSLVFIAALSPAIIFIKVGSAIGSSDARIVYTGNEALANLIWVVVVALVVGAVAIYVARRFDFTKGADKV